jgi:hypothetical protein
MAAAAAIFLAAEGSSVRADSILNFGLDNTGSITATATGGVTTLMTTGGAQKVEITLLNGVAESPGIDAFLTLSATSVGQAQHSLGQDVQQFNGSFTITQNANGTGTNYLSGTFTNLSFDSILSGNNNGTSATLAATDPTATISLTSSVISTLSPPSAAGFTFTNVSPSLHIVNQGTLINPKNTIAGFTASGSGTFSASPNVQSAPEPSSLAIAGIGGLGLIGFGLRRRKALGV